MGCNKTHGQTNTRLFKIWDNMLQRCCNKNYPKYHNYGGRGISVCEEWMRFAPFYEWAMANGYADNLTIDRIDNDKGYSPENCRWVTYARQNNNQRSNCLVEYNGETHTIAEWSRILNINYETLKSRLHKYHLDVEQAFTKKAKGRSKG